MIKPMNMYTKSKPRKRADDEIEELKKDKKSGMSLKDIAIKHGRTEVSISLKLKRLGKKEGNYNKNHIEDKYNTNRKFMEMINPKKVLDLYCGENMWWANNCQGNVYSNDINNEINCEHHKDAERLINELWFKGDRFDIIDLDPYGSAFECIDKAIRMAKKGIIITLGELGHKRFKRLDFVRYRYDIETMEDFTIENLIRKIQRIGLANKKQLTPVFVKERDRIARVYFIIENIKVTEQWEK